MKKILALVPAILVIASPAAVQACAVCYGDPDSSMSKGLVSGVAVLLGVVGVVLGGITTFFVYIAKKAASQSLNDKV